MPLYWQSCLTVVGRPGSLAQFTERHFSRDAATEDSGLDLETVAAVPTELTKQVAVARHGRSAAFTTLTCWCNVNWGCVGNTFLRETSGLIEEDGGPVVRTWFFTLETAPAVACAQLVRTWPELEFHLETH